MATWTVFRGDTVCGYTGHRIPAGEPVELSCAGRFTRCQAHRITAFDAEAVAAEKRKLAAEQDRAKLHEARQTGFTGFGAISEEYPKVIQQVIDVKQRQAGSDDE